MIDTGLDEAPNTMLISRYRLDHQVIFGAALCIAGTLILNQRPASAQSNQIVQPGQTTQGLPKQTAKLLAQPQPKAALDKYLEAQLAREKDKHKIYFDSLAKNATETGQHDAASLRELASQKKAPVYVPNDNAYVPMAARVPGYTSSSSGSSSGSSAALPQRAPVYVSQELEYAKMKEQMAQEKAEQLRQVAAEKQAGLDQSLANMKSQMKESHVPGAAVAKPDGSNLFVRYYGPSNTSKPYEVHQAAARIVPHQ